MKSMHDLGLVSFPGSCAGDKSLGTRLDLESRDGFQKPIKCSTPEGKRAIKRQLYREPFTF